MAYSCYNSRTSSAGKCVCFCKQSTILLTSQIEANPRRHFIRYRYYNDPSKDCKFFRWINEPRVQMQFEGNERHSQVDYITKLNADVEDLKADFDSLIDCAS